MTEPPSPDFITSTQALAADLEARAARLEPWLLDDVVVEWDTFLAHALSKTGLGHSRHHAPSSPRVHGYDLELASGGALFSGTAYYLGDPQDESFTIPWDFIDPSTRAEAEQRIAEEFATEKTANEAATRVQADHQATQKRKADEAELTRLAAALGKTVT